METKELKFKTNINCGGCVSKIKPFLDKLVDTESWQVDTANEDKILTVKTKLSEEDIIDTVEEVGFEIVSIQK
ncbi:heavy-metal-associated domain-containing protein [Chishuiella sp.]|uniref:heavy-metal-associated domain-containing protein n=1 Tax=Chishuiella sp. TaxID=1969467 RepID=UPI0028A8058E|nr:cation transporter [Chishuiella sp.]